jgi:flagellar biosynthetic protein FliR
MNLSGMESLAISYGLVVARVSGLAVALPLFSFEVAPIVFRTMFVLLLSGALFVSMPPVVLPTDLLPAIFMDFLNGVFMGLLVRVALGAVEVAGEIAGVQMGFGFQKTVNPLSREQSGPVTNILFTMAGVLFFTSESHHQVVRGLALSMRTMPLGGSVFRGDIEGLVMHNGASMMEAGFLISLPLIVVSVITQLCFGLLTRVAPQLNVFALGFAFMIGIGFWSLLLFAPNVGWSIHTYFDRSLQDLVSTVAG